MTYTRFTVDNSTHSLWRATFNNPPILLGGQDFNGELAERYGYVNRAIPDDEFEDFVSRFARRLSTFDRQGMADIKHFVNTVSLPADEEFPLQMNAFGQAALRPAMQGRVSKAFEDGYQQRSDVELRLGEYVGQFVERKQTAGVQEV